MARLLRRVLDTVGLPFRALFVAEDSNWLFTSLRDERMARVAELCSGKILDLGCGPGNVFVRRFYRGEGIGADVFSFEGVEVIVQSASLPFRDSSFDTVTLIAVGGHIPRGNREKTFREVERVLRPGGRFVMTEGEIITQTIHHQVSFFLDKFRRNKSADTLRGMMEEEEFAMSHREIGSLLTDTFGGFVRSRFQLGLNNIYLAKKKVDV